MSIFTRRANQHSQGVVEGVRILRQFMPASQLRVLQESLVGEQGAHFRNLIKEMCKRLHEMPGPCESDWGIEGDKIAHLRYRHGLDEWYIFEKGIEGNENAFGVHFPDGRLLKMTVGHIRIDKLRGDGVQLDMDFQPVSIGHIIAKKENIQK